MHPVTRLAFLSTLLVPSALLFAQTAVAPRARVQPFETRAELSFAGSAALAEGSRAHGDISHRQFRFEGVRSLPLADNAALLVGGGWQRFEFSRGDAPIPRSLNALSLKLGYTRPLNAQWSLRAEIDPGLYSDLGDISGGDFNAPTGIRLVHAASRELQWIFGVNIDPRSGHPILGGAGARWQFAEGWTLLALIPEPRIEYKASPALTLFAGASLRSGAYRVAEDFGRRRGRPQLDDQVVDYREINAGAGARWQIAPAMSVSAAAGWMIDRRFEYDKRRLLLNGAGAPALQLSVTGAF